MYETYPFKDGLLKLLAGSSVSLAKGKMVVPKGTATYYIKADFSTVVASTATVSALATSARDNVLKAFPVYFTACESLREKIICLNGDDLLLIRGDTRKLGERDMLGYADSTTGLARAFAIGNNTVTWSSYITVSHIESINESLKVLGLSAKQMLDSSMTVKCSSDPFKAANSALAMGDVYVRFTAVYENVRGRRIGVPVVARSATSVGNKSIKTDDGLVVALEQMKSLATTALGNLAVRRGELPEVDGLGPAAIEAAYERAPDTNAIEAANTESRTLISGLVDSPLSAVTTGAVEGTQEVLQEEWNIRWYGLPALTQNQVFDLVALEASDLNSGKKLLAVNTAAVERVEVEDEHLRFTGATCFEGHEADFFAWSGLMCSSGGQPTVWIPPHLRRQYARRIIEARRPSAEYPSGSTGLVDSIIREAARPIPGAVVAADGFEEVTYVYSEVKRLLEAEAAQLEQGVAIAQAAIAQAGGAKALGKKR